jgi:hypothetical protein
MKNILLLTAITLVAPLASASVASFSCHQKDGQTPSFVNFDETTHILSIVKNGVQKDFLVVRTSEGKANIDTVMLGESKQYGEVQLNLGSKSAMTFQKQISEVDYYDCE